MIKKSNPTITELAKLSGVSRPTVYAWIRSGAVGTDSSGRVDIEDVELWIEQNTIKVVNPLKKSTD